MTSITWQGQNKKNPFCDPISQQQNYNIHKFQILFELTTYNWLQEHKTTFEKPNDIIINNIWHAWKTYDNKCPYHHATTMTWKHNVTKWLVVTNNKLNNPTLNWKPHEVFYFFSSLKKGKTFVNYTSIPCW